MVMKKNTLLYACLLCFFLAFCGEKTDNSNDIELKKKTLKQLQQDVAMLEKEIQELDTTKASDVHVNNKKVSTMVVILQDFKHYIDLQGELVNQSDVAVLPLSGPGLIKAIFVKEGAVVKKGDKLLQLEDTMLLSQRSILESQLDLAKTIYQKQATLWQEKIGSEVQLLTSKTTVDNITKQLSILNTQIQYTSVAAPIDGVVDELNVKVGEIFSGMTMKGESQIRVLDSKNLKVKVNVPENYLSKVNVNTSVRIEFLDNQEILLKNIDAVSKHINPSTRSFLAEIKLNNNPHLRANQLAVVKILDYAVNHATVLPINTIQIDENGKFVFAIHNKNGTKKVVKKRVIVKEVYGENALVTNGVQANDVIITEGFQQVVEGQELGNVD